MIKSIELINWKTHSGTKMNFQKGVNVLIGVMGAGKSSVIDGISFGLFGTFPKLNHKRTAIEDLISNRPVVKDSAEVRIVFTIGSDEYRVTRKINKKESSAARLERNGQYLQTQTARVNEEVESLMKVDYDTFSRAIYAEQNRLDYFLELAKGERKRQIDQMLGLDNFAKAEENATSLVNYIKSIISDEEQMLAQMDRNELKSQLEKLTKEKNDLEDEQERLAAQGKLKGAELKKLDAELRDLKTRSELSKRLSKEIAELSSKIETLGKELRGIELQGIDGTVSQSEYERKTRQREKYDLELKELKKEESAINRMLAESEAIIKVNRKKVEERDRLLESIKGKLLASLELNLEEKNTVLQDLVKERSSLKGRKEEMERQMLELGRHISRCPICERELTEEVKRAILEQKEKAVRDADLVVEDMQKKIEKTEREFNELGKEVERLKLASGKLADYNGIDEIIDKNTGFLKENRERDRKLSESVERQAKETELLNREINDLAVKLDAVKRKQKYEAEIKESAAHLERNKSEMKGINFDEKSLYALQELITKETSVLSDVNSKLGSNQRFIKNIELQIEQNVKNLANMNAIAERIETRRGHLGNMNKFRNALVDTETQLRNSLVSSINALMQDIWSKIYPYGDYQSIRLNARKDDYVLEADTGLDDEGNKRWIEMDGMASGGERSIACLTMRIALAMVIVPNLRWLILDEPTHNIDENGINKLIDVLSNSLPKVVEQIFIITHDNALKNITAARVYQLDRDKNRSEYTSVAEM
jgi:exonuclease SbcC